MPSGKSPASSARGLAETKIEANGSMRIPRLDVLTFRDTTTGIRRVCGSLGHESAALNLIGQ
jgi:hypothetical protein